MTSTAHRILARTAALALLALALNANAQIAGKWEAGDIFLSGTNSTGSVYGKYFVFRPSSAIFIDSVSDTNGANPSFTPGRNNASAIDSPWHLVGTDSSTSSGSSYIVKFRIAPHDASNPTGTITDVVSDFSSAKDGTASSGNPQALVIDAFGNYLVANANPAAIFKFNPAGTAVTTFPFPIVLTNKNLDKQLSGMDINQLESLLYYTSAGTRIRYIQLSTGSISAFSPFSGFTLYDIRVIPHVFLPSGATACGGDPCPAGDGLLVAGTSAVLLVDTSTGKVSHTYYVSGNTNLQALALDPMVIDHATGSNVALPGFWTAGPTSSNFYHVQLSDGSVTSYDASSQGFTGVLSLATYPGFNANQSVPTRYADQTITANAGDVFTTTAQYCYPSGTPTGSAGQYSSCSGQTTATSDELTLIAYANPNFASAYTTTPVVFASAVQPSGDLTDPDPLTGLSLPCLQTLQGTNGPLCTVWQIDIPDSSTLPSNALVAMKIAASQDTAPQPTDANTRGYRDQWNDVTNKIDTGLSGRLSTYDLFEAPGQSAAGAAADCIYYPPVNSNYPNSNTGGTLNNPGNVTFRFTCFGLTNDQIKALVPRISVVELGTGSAPEPYFPYFTSLTGGTCCTQANYRLDTTTTPYTWVINVSFQNLPTNNVQFTATTYDSVFKIAAFDLTFTILNGAQNLK